MNNKLKTNLGGRILVIVLAILSIFSLLGDWLDAFGYSVSLFKITDVMEDINFFANSEEIDIYVTIIRIVLIVYIVEYIAIIIMAIINSDNLRNSASGILTSAILLVVVFFGFIFYVNEEIGNAFFGIGSGFLGFTIHPVLLALYSIFMYVGASLRDTSAEPTTYASRYEPTYTSSHTSTYATSYTPSYSSGGSYATKQKCVRCGAEIDNDSTFCKRCGTRISTPGEFAGRFKYGTKCGARNSKDSYICSHCGKTL